MFLTTFRSESVTSTASSVVLTAVPSAVVRLNAGMIYSFMSNGLGRILQTK